MVAAAQREAARRKSTARFEVGDTGSVAAGGRLFDVVSAASLLIVLPDAAAGLRELWAGVRPGGSLLVVETTPRLTPRNARALLPNERHPALLLWARVRNGRAVDERVFRDLGTPQIRTIPLLEGLVAAWVLEKPGASGAA